MHHEALRFGHCPFKPSNNLSSFRGYFDRVLTRQGEDAPGERYDYVITGNMIAGFALLAYPADYGVSGIMTFLVSHESVVYQKDL